MDIGTIGKAVGITAAVGIGLAALSACSQKNEDKTSEAVAGDVTRRYDKNSDGNLNLEFESTRDVPGSRCISRWDSNMDGTTDFADACLVTDDYVNRYTISALLTRADQHHGDKDGVATQSEVASVVKEFDVGGGAKSEAIAGNNILERDEIKVFNKSYEEQFQGEIG